VAQGDGRDSVDRENLPVLGDGRVPLVERDGDAAAPALHSVIAVRFAKTLLERAEHFAGRLLAPFLLRFADEREEDVDVLEGFRFCMPRVRAGKKVTLDIEDGLDLIANALVSAPRILSLSAAELEALTKGFESFSGRLHFL